ncbi:S41 family peptidase [Chitinophaga sancti]|uniref:Peptidase family S41 n=1 Tax=Chitinophaga sancti TaxID=1004 RepID=A0A1K1LUS6_9BACT|nr:S41 family peptidase [Chitinophaga sancti]WQD64906.1 S41 family peptidase [Chitinophaga sancti]WQG89470.1 S41 family peptidase [Chitinophaga sancti]SFW13422.1 Peptidase family S41 [Chitinophaga sancti]
MKLLYAWLLSCCLCVSVARAQWTAVSYPAEIVNKWTPDAFVKSAVRFPDLKDSLGILINEKGTRLPEVANKLLSDAEWGSDTFLFKQLLPAGTLSFNYDAGRLNLSYYTQNVKKIMLACQGIDGSWHYKEIPVAYDGFQPPVASYISTWEHSNGEAFEEENLAVKCFMLLYVPVKPAQRSAMVVGELRVDEFRIRPGRNVFAWIDSLTGQPQETYTRMFGNYSSYFYEHGTSARRQVVPVSFEEFGLEKGYLTGYVNFIGDSSHDAEVKLLAGLMRSFTELYPYEKQRAVNRAAAQAALDSVFKDSNRPYPALLADLKITFKRCYSDPHLDITLPLLPAKPRSARLRNGPLRLRTIGDDVVVAAVLNDQYRDSIQPGAKVVALDGLPVPATGDPNLLLFRKETDTLHISLADDSTTKIRTVHIPYTLPVRAGSNFSPQPGVEWLSKDMVLIRVGNWKGDEYYWFLNAFYNRPGIKGVIIDLRGNGGGYSADVMKTLSLFADQAYSLGKRHYPWFDESMLVTPLPLPFRCNPMAKVVILADKGTACAAEMFILGMKRRPNTFLVGDSPTMGAIASPVIFHFPSGLLVQLHTTFRELVFDPALYTEGKGIMPDIWVARTHARDLAPYQDKLLQYAKQLIQL